MISIILFNWNGSKYIFDCIKSITNQIYSDIDVIVVDGFRMMLEIK